MNIASPKRRIHLFPIADDTLEIVLLGDSSTDEATPEAENIAAVFVHMRKLVESWPGWDRREILAMGAAVIGLRVHIGKHGQRPTALAEALAMFEGLRGIRWRSGGGTDADSRLGMVGEW